MSILSASRLEASIKLKTRKLRPSDNGSCIKAIDQHWLLASGTTTGSCFSRTIRLRGLIRRFSSSSR